jgi:putative transposase
VTAIANAIGVSRSNIYEEEKARAVTKASDDELLPVIKELDDKRLTYVYRRITALLRGETREKVNVNRVYRIMKQKNLLLQKFGAKLMRSHDGKVATLRINIRWCSDAFGIQCWNGDQLQVAFTLDCHDREVIGLFQCIRLTGAITLYNFFKKRNSCPTSADQAEQEEYNKMQEELDAVGPVPAFCDPGDGSMSGL